MHIQYVTYISIETKLKSARVYIYIYIRVRNKFQRSYVARDQFKDNVRNYIWRKTQNYVAMCMK